MQVSKRRYRFRVLFVLASLLVNSATIGCRTTAARHHGNETFQVKSAEPQPAFTDDELNSDLYAYAEQCKAELGITSPLPDMNCLSGVEVPITVNGTKVDANLLEDLRLGRKGCDNAQWLDGACWTYDLVQRVEIPSNPAIEGVLNCRQKLYTNHLSPAERMTAYRQAVARNAPPAEQTRLFRLVFEFDDMGLILRNKNTGKSCFFTFFGSFASGNSFYGGWIPAPDRRTIPDKETIFREKLPEPKPPVGYAEKMWNRGPKGYETAAGFERNMFFSPEETAGGQCVGCHNQGAFKHSPFIDQAVDTKGRIVPSNRRNVPYLPVGPAFQESFRRSRLTEVKTAPVGGNRQVCTGCHAMNTGSSERVSWSIGIGVPQTSEQASTFPHKAWMPEGHGAASEDQYQADYGKHIQAMRCCLANPNASGCFKRTIGPTLEDIGLRLGEPLNEASWVAGTASSGNCEVGP